MPSSNAALHSGNPLIFKGPASPTKICLKGGEIWNFLNQACVSLAEFFLGRGVNMTKRSGKFENVYSEIAWRGQSEQRREGADGCKMQQELAAFQHEDKCAGFPSGVVFSRVFWWVMREVR